MQTFSDAGRALVDAMAARHGVSADAVAQLLMALAAGGGTQAQFNHPDLGGMGQWSQGGMIMVGDMFNNGLKYRVEALCNDLAVALRDTALFAATPPAGHAPRSSQSQSQSQSSGGGGGGGSASLFVPGAFASRWPAELGAPSSTGSQNDLHYAVFPATHRLAIDHGGRVTVYDTGDHRISGFSQQQSGDQSITFTSQFGLVRVADLKLVTAPGNTPAQAEAPAPQAHPIEAGPAPAAAAVPASSDDEIFSRIERLADLRKKDIITAAEFDAKKAELLARL